MGNSGKVEANRWEEINAACDALSETEEELTREMVMRLADKWSLWTLAILAEEDGPLRFTRLMERVEGVSQKSLTKTLRALERDGLITRQIFAEVPPRVEYTITALGLELLSHVEPLWNWVARSVPQFQRTRQEFEAR
ncbi:helix-turn-helix domain-containing protein [Granulicella sp. L46]|uniref:winged helix-turn-helix transcriptional regulator n=1 Tax=Granulicella sp. L46 TaxID=1641865 RepID=UPI00131E04A8|nr:helix-turn-helix domain-containing protein [Granulicella sp. L46]